MAKKNVIKKGRKKAEQEVEQRVLGLSRKEVEQLKKDVRKIDRKVHKGIKRPELSAPEEKWNTYFRTLAERRKALPSEEKEKLKKYNSLLEWATGGE